MESALMCDALADLADCDLFPDTDPLPPVKTFAEIVDDPAFCAGIQMFMAFSLAMAAADAQRPTEASARAFRAGLHRSVLPVIGGA